MALLKRTMGILLVLVGVLFFWANENRFDYYDAAKNAKVIGFWNEHDNELIALTGKLDMTIPVTGEYVEQFGSFYRVWREEEIFIWTRCSGSPFLHCTRCCKLSMPGTSPSPAAPITNFVRIRAYMIVIALLVRLCKFSFLWISSFRFYSTILCSSQLRLNSISSHNGRGKYVTPFATMSFTFK